IGDGGRVVTASADGGARIWNAEASADLVHFPVGEHGAVEFLPQHIATIDGEGTVLAWRMPAGPLETIRVPEDGGPAALAANGQLAMPGRDRVALSEIGSSREVAPLPFGGDIDWDEFRRRAHKQLSRHQGNFEIEV